MTTPPALSLMLAIALRENPAVQRCDDDHAVLSMELAQRRLSLAPVSGMSTADLHEHARTCRLIMAFAARSAQLAEDEIAARSAQAPVTMRGAA